MILNSYSYTATAVVAGYLLIDSLTIDEQQNISAWLMVVADILNVNAVYATYLKNQQDKEKDTEDQKDTANDTKDSDTKDDEEKYDKLTETINNMQKEIDLLKKQVK